MTCMEALAKMHARMDTGNLIMQFMQKQITHRFSLHANVSYIFLCSTQKRDVCTMALLIVFQYPAVFRNSWKVLSLFARQWTLLD